MDWMKIKNETKESADLYFYGDIVSDWYGAWADEDQYPDSIRNFLEGVKGKNLNIYVNSGGGSVFGGLAIYNMLKRHDGYKTAYIDGVGASISSVIPLAADKVIIPSNAYLMIHKPWVGTAGNAFDLRKLADDLDAIEEGIMNVYKDNLREGVDIETIREMVQKETWLNGLEAAKYFNVEVSEENKMVARASDYYKGYKNMPHNIMENKVNKEREVHNRIKELELELELI